MPGTGGCGAGCGLLHPLGVHPASLLLLIVEAMTLGVPPDGGGSLDQLPGVGIHTPALPTLPVQRHLALRREEEAVENMSLQPPAFFWSLNPRCELRWHRASCAGYDFSTLNVCRGILLKCRFPFSESGVGMANKLPCDIGASGPGTTL